MVHVRIEAFNMISHIGGKGNSENPDKSLRLGYKNMRSWVGGGVKIP